MDEVYHRKLSCLLTVMMIADSDGHQHEFEEMYLYEVAERLRLESDEVRKLQKDPTSVNYSLPQSGRERINLLYDMLFMMKMDGVIDEKEQELFRELGFLLGFRPTTLNEYIQITKEYAGQTIPEGILLEVLRRDLN